MTVRINFPEKVITLHGDVTIECDITKEEYYELLNIVDGKYNQGKKRPTYYKVVLNAPDGTTLTLTNLQLYGDIG